MLRPYPKKRSFVVYLTVVILLALSQLWQLSSLSRFQPESGKQQAQGVRLDQEGSATRLAFIQHDALRQEEEKQESDIEAKVPKHFLEEEESLPCSLLSKDFNNSGNVVAAVLVIAYNRPAYLKRTLNTLEKRLRARSVAEKFPIFVSQDGDVQQVEDVIQSFSIIAGHLKHTRETLTLSDISSSRGKNQEMLSAGEMTRSRSYCNLSLHYKWALGQVFSCLSGLDRVIILEDDMEVSVDFFSYFEGTSFLLDEDPSIYTISSWNDNGFEDFVQDPREVYRTDSTPGLGWMMSRRLWSELEPAWPTCYWDEWMRKEEQRRGRQSIAPEISRNVNFGEFGVSRGQYESSSVSRVKGNDVYVNFKELDLTYLLRDNFKESLYRRVDRSLLIDLENANELSRDSKVTYSSTEDLKRALEFLGMSWEMGRRGIYEGIIHLRRGRHMLYIVPSNVTSVM